MGIALGRAYAANAGTDVPEARGNRSNWCVEIVDKQHEKQGTEEKCSDVKKEKGQHVWNNLVVNRSFIEAYRNHGIGVYKPA